MNVSSQRGSVEKNNMCWCGVKRFFTLRLKKKLKKEVAAAGKQHIPQYMFIELTGVAAVCS